MIKAIKKFIFGAPDTDHATTLDKVVVMQYLMQYHLEKRMQRLETWMVLQQQLTATRAPGSQDQIRDDHLRYNQKTVDKSLGKL